MAPGAPDQDTVEGRNATDEGASAGTAMAPAVATGSRTWG